MLIVISLGLIALGIYDLRRQRLPDDVVILDGTVTRISRRRSSISGRRKRILEAPVVEYRHPDTGRTVEVEPTSYGGKVPAVGERVSVAHSPGTDEARYLHPRPWRGFAALAGLGTVLIVLQVLDWVT